jgi:hypothetical protein
MTTIGLAYQSWFVIEKLIVENKVGLFQYLLGVNKESPSVVKPSAQSMRSQSISVKRRSTMNIDHRNSAQDPLLRILTLFSTILGLFLVGFGIWALAGAVYVTWELFKEPDSISYFAKYFIETARITARLTHDGESLAHLLSWFTVVLLLLLLGKLGDWCITSGAQLFMFGKTRSKSGD